MGKRVWSKKAVLRESLLGIARSLGPGQRMPTVAMLCKSLSVSNSTLDPILRELGTQGAIRREHGRGIFVSPTIHQKTVGVVFGGDIFGNTHSPFWSLLLQAMRKQAGGHALRPRGYLDISQGRDGLGGHAQLIEDIEDRRLDGLLLIEPRLDSDQAGQLRAYGVPLVVFGGRSPGWTVTHDVAALLALAARELAAGGCRRVALLGNGALAHRPRLKREMREAGAADAQVADWSYETWAARIPWAGSVENCAYLLTQRLIAARTQTPWPDAVVSLDDTMTRGVITALQQAGLQPGRDLRIVTAANTGSPVLMPYAADLVAIEFDPAESVRAALAMLGTLMEGGTPESNPVLIAPKPREQTPRNHSCSPVSSPLHYPL